MKNISEHAIKVFLTLKSHPKNWMTNKEIHQQNGEISRRTVAAHTAAMAEMGVAEKVALFPDARFRLNANPNGNAAAYLSRLNTAARMLGLD